MRIEHVAIWANDLEALKEYYVRFFAAQAGDLYHNERTGFRSYFLTFDSGARLEIMSSPTVDGAADGVSRIGYAHMAFSVGSMDEVDALTEAIRSAGYSVVNEPRTTGDGYYESVVQDPEGNLVEITV
ncbi:MAG TPA: hypothetical protein GX702_14145 [Chloroflexi bacterium]|jgi:lactoylglutathione lyase|nr:hypothetical protein [Chloroflexota bacterium]